MKNILLALFLLCATPILPFSGGVQTPVELDSGGSEDVSSLVTASVSPTSNALLLMIGASANNPARTHGTPTDTFTGTGAWTLERGSVQGFGRITIYSAIAGSAPGSGAVTQTFNAEANRGSFFLVEVTGFDRGTVTREGKNGIGTGTTLACADLDDLINGTLAFGAIISIGDSDGITAGSGETELGEATSGGSNEARIQVQYGDGSNDVTFNWSALNTTGNAGVVIEINSDPGIIVGELKFRVLSKGFVSDE